MNRRDFIGAAIGALVAALLLPFEEFAAWCKRWFSTRERLREVSEKVLSQLHVGWRTEGHKVGGLLNVFDVRGYCERVRIVQVNHLSGTLTVEPA